MSAPPGNPTSEPLEQAPLTPCPALRDGGRRRPGVLPRVRPPAARTPRGSPARLGAAWQRRLPWYPGDWLWPVLGLVADRRRSARRSRSSPRPSDAPAAATPTVVLTSPCSSSLVPTTPTVPDADRADARSPTVTGAAEAAQAAAAAEAGRRRSSSGRRPTAATRRPRLGPEARRHARPRSPRRTRRSRPGLTRVGVLDSDRFSSLHPGYYVVFSGIYGSYSQANAQLDRAHARATTVAYPRRVTR